MSSRLCFFVILVTLKKSKDKYAEAPEKVNLGLIPSSSFNLAVYIKRVSSVFRGNDTGMTAQFQLSVEELHEALLRVKNQKGCLSHRRGGWGGGGKQTQLWMTKCA